MLSEFAQQQLAIDRDWQKTVAAYPDDVGNIPIYWLALETPEIVVKVNWLNISDMARKIKYDLMKTGNLFKNKN